MFLLREGYCVHPQVVITVQGHFHSALRPRLFVDRVAKHRNLQLVVAVVRDALNTENSKGKACSVDVA